LSFTVNCPSRRFLRISTSTPSTSASGTMAA
jgi:hypothetical protein